MQALKDKDKATRAALSTVINKYMLLNVENKAKGKETTDADVISILQKSVKELEEEKNMFVKAARQDKIDEMNIQINAVKKYLPEMMSEDEIRKSSPDLKINLSSQLWLILRKIMPVR